MLEKTLKQHKEFVEALGQLQSSQEKLRGGDMRPEALQYSKALMDALATLNERLKSLEAKNEEGGIEEEEGLLADEKRQLRHERNPTGL